MSEPRPFLAGVVGFLLGGLVVETFTLVVGALVAGGSLGGMIGAIFGALRKDVDAERAAGLGGAAGLFLAAASLLVDALISG